VLTTTDPQSNTTTATYTVVCAPVSGDSACYEATTTHDPLAHQQQTFSDAFGRTVYSATYTGNGSGSPAYTRYALTTATYDYVGDVTAVREPDGTHTLTYTYDAAGRVTSMSDPDRGTETYTYDPNGNLTESVDARGACPGASGAPCGSTWIAYDGLNRVLWQSATYSGPASYATYTYDESSGHGVGAIGHLTTETFNHEAGATLGYGTISYSYDSRGQMTSMSEYLDRVTYPFSFGYNDAGQPTSVSYSDNTYLCDSYDSASGWLSMVSVTQANASNGCATSQQTTLASGLGYSGDAGAAGLVTNAIVSGGTYLYAASYDEDLRLLSSSLRLTPNLGGGMLYQQALVGYDAASNVTGLATTLGTGGLGGSTQTDNQAFCYDEQNRLVWASSQSATGPNGCATNTAGTLTGGNAQYTASYAYDTLDRLTSGPANGGSSYTYGDASHLHATTSTSGGSSAGYDASGNMLCRALTNASTCAGSSPTGQVLSYDPDGTRGGRDREPGGRVTVLTLRPSIAVRCASRQSRVAGGEDWLRLTL
jgi:YD repeat-containing protein